MNPQDALKDWLNKLFDDFRKEANNLSTEEQRAISWSLEDLMPPCQVIVIWARDPEFQILIFTHLEYEGDKLVIIFGPVENNKLLDLIEKEVLVNQLVGRIGTEYVESYLVSAIRDIQRVYGPVSGPLKHRIGRKTNITIEALGKAPETLGWIVYGNICNIEVKTIVKESIESIKGLAKPPTAPPVPPEEKVVLKGWGSYIYPPIWIGELPKPTFRDKIMGLIMWKYTSERIVDMTYKGYPLIITRDGYIAIGIEDRSKALEALNEIMATMLICRIPAYVIREIELGEATFKEKGYSRSGRGFGVRAGLLGLFGIYELYDEIISSRRVAAPPNIITSIKWAELLTTDNMLKTRLLLFLEAKTHMLNSEYKQALLIAWIILESYIDDTWLNHIKKVVKDKDRINKLERWTIDDILEAMNIARIISNDQFKALMEIKGERNAIMHEGKEPSKNLTEKSLDLSFKVIHDYIGKFISVHGLPPFAPQ